MDFVWRHVTVGILPNGFQTHTPFALLTLHFTSRICICGLSTIAIASWQRILIEFQLIAKMLNLVPQPNFILIN